MPPPPPLPPPPDSPSPPPYEAPTPPATPAPFLDDTTLILIYVGAGVAGLLLLIPLARVCDVDRLRALTGLVDSVRGNGGGPQVVKLADQPAPARPPAPPAPAKAPPAPPAAADAADAAGSLNGPSKYL